MKQRKRFETIGNVHFVSCTSPAKEAANNVIMYRTILASVLRGMTSIHNGRPVT